LGKKYSKVLLHQMALAGGLSIVVTLMLMGSYMFLAWLSTITYSTFSGRPESTEFDVSFQVVV